jgi:hypothetical protein
MSAAQAAELPGLGKPLSEAAFALWDTWRREQPGKVPRSRT